MTECAQTQLRVGGPMGARWEVAGGIPHVLFVCLCACMLHLAVLASHGGLEAATRGATEPEVTIRLLSVDHLSVTEPAPLWVPTVSDLVGWARGIKAGAQLWVATRPQRTASWVVRGPYSASPHWEVKDARLSDPRLTTSDTSLEIVCVISAGLTHAGLITDTGLEQKSLARSNLVRVRVSDPKLVTGPCRVAIGTVGGTPARRTQPTWVTRAEQVAGFAYNVPPQAYVGLAVLPIDSFDYWVMQGTSTYGSSGRWSQIAYFGRQPASFTRGGKSMWAELDEHKRFRLIAFVTRDDRFRQHYPRNRVNQAEWHRAVNSGKFLAVDEVQTAREFDIGVVITRINLERTAGNGRITAKPVANMTVEVDRPLPPGCTITVALRTRRSRKDAWSNWHIAAENLDPGAMRVVNVYFPRELGLPGEQLDAQAFVFYHPGTAVGPATVHPAKPNSVDGTSGDPPSGLNGLPLIPDDRWGRFRSFSRRIRLDITDPEAD